MVKCGWLMFILYYMIKVIYGIKILIVYESYY